MLLSSQKKKKLKQILILLPTHLSSFVAAENRISVKNVQSSSQAAIKNQALMHKPFTSFLMRSKQ